MNSIKIPKRITEELAEETGLHLGDGTMNFYKNKKRIKGLFSLRGHIIDDREHYNTRIKELYKNIYNLDISLRSSKKTGVYGFQKWSDEIVNYKNKELGLPLGKKDTTLSIPKIFLTKKSFKIAVLRGIFDTDGGVYLENKRGRDYPRLKISSTSKILIEQVLSILKELKIHATVYINKIK